MIQLAGSAQRSFVFPSNLQEAFAFYGDIRQSFRYLIRISVIHSYAPGSIACSIVAWNQACIEKDFL
jgi:hypothetical protein